MVVAVPPHFLTDMHPSLLSGAQNWLSSSSKMPSPKQHPRLPSFLWSSGWQCDMVQANGKEAKVYWEPLEQVCFSWCEGAGADGSDPPFLPCAGGDRCSGHLATTRNKHEDKSSGMEDTAKRWKEFESLMTSLSSQIYTRNCLHLVFLISEKKQHLYVSVTEIMSCNTHSQIIIKWYNNYIIGE